MEFEGTVFKIMPPTSGTSARGEWQRQEVIFDTQSQSQYPRKICVTFFNKPEEVARLREGAAYTVSIDVESREYNGRWYTDIRAWRIEPAGQQHSQPAAAYPAHTAAPAPAPMPTVDDLSSPLTDDDLPF